MLTILKQRKLVISRIILLISMFVGHSFLWADRFEDVQTNKKKKLLLFTSKGGAGHMIACNALKKMLSEYYDINIINPFEEVVHSLDMVRTITRKKLDGEGLYNYMLANGWIRTTNFMAHVFAPFMLRRNRRTMKKLMYELFQEERPDMIISTIPYLNLPASNAAHALDIPYLIISLDGCLANWGCMMRRHMHQKINWTIGIDVPTTRGLLNNLGFADENIQSTGYPLRDDFNEKKDIPQIKHDWNIPDNKFVVMVLMGGAGGTATVKYVQTMYHQNLPIHVIACIGRDKKSGNDLESLKKRNKNSQVTLTIVPFTTRISDLMAASELLVTKPGPGTINEALNMDLPLFLDSTGALLFWERANVDFVVKNNFGKVIYKTKQFNQLLQKCVNNKEYYQGMKKAVKAYKKEPFNDNIKRIVFSMCPPYSAVTNADE